MEAAAQPGCPVGVAGVPGSVPKLIHLRDLTWALTMARPDGPRRSELHDCFLKHLNPGETRYLFSKHRLLQQDLG